ncbi:regulator of chromosome condensation [Cryptosporidium sp. chipmunk genotype I]|uniref:regulator of chromosome condensation n=1 Tax=Cryptosporidium sp. chipmunk genotype I TaxID=1280935 RepID=UPI00351A6B5F|nr:regulator of chromosome condensation [Cryptosporidium sp. chipmunk genotype I]
MGWKCTVCLVTNDEDAKVCACCEYAREKDGQEKQLSGPIFSSSVFSSSPDSSCPVFTFGAPVNSSDTTNQNSEFFSTFGNIEKSPTTPIVAEETPVIQSVDIHQEIKEERKQYFDKFNSDFIEYKSFIKKAPSNNNNVPLGTVWVWGSGECDQLGMKESLLDEDLCLKIPKRIETISKDYNIVDIASGALHNLILTDQGEIFSWGCNDDGALGRLSSKLKAKLEKLNKKVDNDKDRGEGEDEEEEEEQEEEEPEDSEKYPNKIEFPLDVKSCQVKSIISGDCYSCCLTESGEVYLWGSYKDSGGYIGFPNFQLMNGSLVGYKQYNPVRVPIFGMKEYSPSVGIGRGNIGRKKIKLEKEMDLKVVGKARKILGGENHTIVVTEDMRIFAWGSTEFGQFGIKPVEDKMEKTKYLYPMEIDHDILGFPSHLVIQDIYCGRASTFFVVKDVNMNTLQVFACGRNGRNELGIFEKSQENLSEENNNEDPIVFRPKKVNIADFETECSKCKSTKPIKQIGGGQYYSALLTCCGEVFIWGMKDCCGLEGQLIKNGNENMTKERDIKVPTKIEHLKNIKRLGFGADSCFAIDVNGILFVWGMNLTGQIGIKRLIDSEVVLNPQIMNPKTFLLENDGFDSNFVLKAVGGSQHSMALIWNGSYSSRLVFEEEEEEEEEEQEKEEAERGLKRMNAKRFDEVQYEEGEEEEEQKEERKGAKSSSKGGRTTKKDPSKTVIKKIEKTKSETGGTKATSKAKSKTKTVISSKTTKTRAKAESKSASKPTNKAKIESKTTKPKAKAKENASCSKTKAETKTSTSKTNFKPKTKTEPKTSTSKDKTESKTAKTASKAKTQTKNSVSSKAKSTSSKTKIKAESKTESKTSISKAKTTKTKTTSKPKNDTYKSNNCSKTTKCKTQEESNTKTKPKSKNKN